MTQQQLQEIMIFHLTNLNATANKIDENSIHSNILSDDDGHGAANSKNIYRACIRWTFKQNGLPDNPWPADWFQNSVGYLASKLV
ncbi:MAG: hypothetical protein QM737_05865 [Ferruginibacter sp.]